ncbi:MAG: FadR family transcriptional regulator [Conexibacter sp.]|nr:FadR family transcriptional regulator [Conexibacter sp.]
MSDTGPNLLRGVPIRRVRKAFEQVAEQLLEVITSGVLAPGQRLPTEAILAAEFGVSRATVREALRLLSAQGLVRTAKGTGGGSYVNVPTVDGVSEIVSSNLGLMSASAELSLDDFLEARELLELPATRLATLRSSPDDVRALLESVPDNPLALSVEQQFVHNRDFHFQLVHASGNPLLSIAAQPIFVVLQTHLQRSKLPKKALQAINDEHQEIALAMQTGDADAAEDAMRRHLRSLRPGYERTWNRRGTAR